MYKQEIFEKEQRMNEIEEDFQGLKNSKNSTKIKNMNLMLFRDNQVSKYCWEIDGEKVKFE
jgi:hypothetical protein